MATIKDLRVKVRLNVLSVLLRDQGDPDHRPGRQGTQRKTIIDIPEFEITRSEFEIRLEKAQQVLKDGYWVDPDNVPPKVITDDASSITTEAAELNGQVEPCSLVVTALCGFQYGTTPALGSTVFADESPVSSENYTPITYGLSGLTPNTKYYYRAFAADINFSGGKFGVVKSFYTLAEE